MNAKHFYNLANNVKNLSHRKIKGAIHSHIIADLLNIHLQHPHPFRTMTFPGRDLLFEEACLQTGVPIEEMVLIERNPSFVVKDITPRLTQLRAKYRNTQMNAFCFDDINYYDERTGPTELCARDSENRYDLIWKDWMCNLNPNTEGLINLTATQACAFLGRHGRPGLLYITLEAQRQKLSNLQQWVGLLKQYGAWERFGLANASKYTIMQYGLALALNHEIAWYNDEFQANTESDLISIIPNYSFFYKEGGDLMFIAAFLTARTTRRSSWIKPLECLNFIDPHRFFDADRNIKRSDDLERLYKNMSQFPSGELSAYGIPRTQTPHQLFQSILTNNVAAWDATPYNKNFYPQHAHQLAA